MLLLTPRRFVHFLGFVVLGLALVACDQSQSGAGSGHMVSRETAERMDAGAAFYDAGRYQEAADAYLAATVSSPDSPGAWSSLGFALMGLDRLDEAKDAFEKSRDLQADWTDAHLGLGILARKNDDYDAAYGHYETALLHSPSDGQVLASMLVIDLRRGHFALAVEHGERGLELVPNDPVVAANLAVAYHYTEQFAKRDLMALRANTLGYHNMEAIERIFSGELTVGPD